MRLTIVRPDQRQPFFRSGPPPPGGVTTKGTGVVETSIQKEAAETVHSIPGKGTRIQAKLNRAKDGTRKFKCKQYCFSNEKSERYSCRVSCMLGVDSYKINRESSWKATASLRKLEVHHKRPVGLRYYKGLLHGLCVSTNAIKEAHIQSGSINVNVERLINKGEVSKIPNPQAGFYSNLLLVQKKDGGLRPVINLKALNQHVRTQHFKMEGIHTLKELIRPGDWLAKVDLKDTYFSIPINPAHRRFLQFVFQEQTYEFNCLPFGLTSAPWVFTKTLKPVSAILRELGVCMIVYIDDILLLAESSQSLEDHVAGLVYLLECLGFIMNK